MSKKLKLKGLGAPRIFIWMLGFIHGCIFRTAVIDQETGYISSAYIIEKCRLFNKLSSEYVVRMENELKAVRSEASELMANEAALRKQLREIKMPEMKETVADKRAARTAADNLSACDGKHRDVLDRLVEINGKIVSREVVGREELDATASALQGLFAVYAKGMLIKPVRETMIPPVGYEKCFEIYHQAHEKEEEQMEFVLKEVYCGEK